MWSSGKVQDSWSLDHQNVVSSSPATASVFVFLGKILNQFASLTRAYLVPVGCGKYYNLSADRACTWPVANRSRWSEMIVMISWRGNNITQQRFVSLGKGAIQMLILLLLLLLLPTPTPTPYPKNTLVLVLGNAFIFYIASVDLHKMYHVQGLAFTSVCKNQLSLKKIYGITQWEELILVSGCCEYHCKNPFSDFVESEALLTILKIN